MNPSTGVAGPYLIDNTWYDATNNVLCSLPAGSQAFSKSTFDGLGRPIAGYAGYNPSGVIVPNSVSSDLIFEQVETQFDSDSSVLFSTSRQRWQGASGVGPLKGPSGSGPNSRDSYIASWYDGSGRQIASANYGTNDDAGPPERPDAPPASSDLVLVSLTNYNERGEGFESIDPAGQVSRQYGDDAGRTVRTIQNYVGSVAADGTPCLMPGNDENIIVDFVFGPGSLLYQLIARNPTTGDQVTRYQYGVDMSTSDLASNRLLAAEIFPDAADSSDRESYAYNRQAQVKQRTDRNGSVHEYLFDLLGRQTSDIVSVLAAGVDGSVLRIDQSYEIRGMVATITSFSDTAGATPANQVQNTYNDFTQLSVQYQAHSGLVNTGTTPAVQYGYVNAVNNTIRPVSIIYPNGRVLNIEYASGDDDSLSRVTDLKITGESTPAVAYTYFGLGSFASTSYPQPGIANTMASGGSFPGFDLFGRVINLPWVRGSTTLAEFRYGYNRASNRTYRQDVAATAAGKNLDELYQYDGLQRLQKYHQGQLASGNTNIQFPGVQQGWKLDATGNWQNFSNFDPNNPAAILDQDRASNAFNEITAITNTVGAPWVTPTYDRNGNTTTIPKPNDLAQGYGAVYDAWNRLVAVNTGGGSPQNAVAYKYDGLNRRIVEQTFSPPGTLSETRDLYYSSNWQVLEERVNGASTAETQYVWGLRYIDDCILRDRDTTGGGTFNERLYAVQDANWNVVAIVDVTGTVQERYTYTPYGVVTVYDGNWTALTMSAFHWRHLFQGKRIAAMTGGYSSRNREYFPILGAWLQPDPIEYRSGDHSLYRYVINNPESVVDSFGLYVEAKTGELIYKDIATGDISPSMRGGMWLDADVGRKPDDWYKIAAKGYGFDKSYEVDKRYGTAIYLEDTHKGEKCADGRGDRVWVVFLNVSADSLGLYTGDKGPKHLVGRLNKWTYDWEGPKTFGTTEKPWTDYPGFDGQGNSTVTFTQFVGIACRCISNNNVFKKDLLAWGIWAGSIQTRGEKLLVTADIGKGFPESKAGDLAKDGNWLDVMNTEKNTWNGTAKPWVNDCDCPKPSP